MTTAFLVESTRDDSTTTSLRAMEADPTRWKILQQFDFGAHVDVTEHEARTDASRTAMRLRDAGRHTTGICPVLRVRKTGVGTELIMQRLRYRVRGPKT